MYLTSLVSDQRSESPNLFVKGETSLPQVKFPIYRTIQTNVTSLKSTAQNKLKIAINLENFIGKVGIISLYMNHDSI